jgi:hypothetical protein
MNTITNAGMQCFYRTLIAWRKKHLMIGTMIRDVLLIVKASLVEKIETIHAKGGSQ